LLRDTGGQLGRRKSDCLLLLRERNGPLATALQYQSIYEFRQRSPFAFAADWHFADRATLVHLEREPLFDADFDTDRIELYRAARGRQVSVV
jgi:hypothetical protein